MPDTVRFLSLFALTLLDWSEGCSFVLVPNGCGAAESRFLRDLAERPDRFEFLDLGLNRPTNHATTLERLLALERGDRFCFLDTDILADGEWLPTVMDAFESHAGVFACPPIWALPDDQVHRSGWQHLGGRYNVTDSGLVLGGTYLAVYEVKPLRAVLKQGASLNRAPWEALPPAVRGSLEKLNMQKEFYDTAKVANLLLAAQGHALINVDLPHLHHIGGVSIVAGPGLPDIKDRRAAKLASVASDERASIEERLTRRETTADHVGRLFRHLFDGDDLPAPARTGNDDVDERLDGLSSRVIAAYNKHSAELDF